MKAECDVLLWTDARSNAEWFSLTSSCESIPVAYQVVYVMRAGCKSQESTLITYETQSLDHSSRPLPQGPSLPAL